MRNTLFAFCAAAAALFAQSDGQPHGDPPYLLESGWTPLLTGRDFKGWLPERARPSEWIAAHAIYWDPLKSPKALSAIGGPGDRILNGPKGNTANLVTAQKFGDMELYVEFMVPQGSNSGVYLHGLYEVQVFDSYGKPAVNTTDAGAIYHRWINEKPVGGSAPKVNAARRPGEWQSYQIWFRGPRFDAAGKKTENARFLRVLHNGVLVQENVEVDGGTRAHMDIPEAAANPVMLQGDHGPVAYRNIYWRPLRPIIAP
ncbi:MAG: DUF1080 domain-containing protein [Bryobacteraceae bacterium]|nr:DUF1080 domain-containing protein [Bryobacteraceae bacterium]